MIDISSQIPTNKYFFVTRFQLTYEKYQDVWFRKMSNTTTFTY